MCSYSSVFHTLRYEHKLYLTMTLVHFTGLSSELLFLLSVRICLKTNNIDETMQSTVLSEYGAGVTNAGKAAEYAVVITCKTMA